MRLFWKESGTGPQSIDINKPSKNVTGTYLLSGPIAINTISGNIDISIEIPSTETSWAQTPATIALTTVSGSITVSTLNLSDIPSKAPNIVLESELKTTSGSINAILPHSTSTTITTTSGNITAILHPLKPTTKSTIYLKSVSGTTNLKVHPTLINPATPTRFLSTAAESVSGKVKLTYPLTWEGEVECKTTSGTTTWDWPGLNVTRAGSSMSARKGSGQGRVSVEGQSTIIQLLGRDFGVDFSGQLGNTRGNASVKKEGRREGADGNSRTEAKEQEQDAPPSYKEVMKM